MPASKPSNCIHCLKTIAYAVNSNSKIERPIGAIYLCGWPDSLEGLKLLHNTPRWMQNNSLAGHLMQDGDCVKCPKFQDRGKMPIQEVVS